MTLWGLPPKYGVYPISILTKRLPPYLKMTYVVLCALAWRTDKRAVLQSTEQLAELFSELEEKPLSVRGMRKRLELLSKAGLIERVKRQGRWITVLRLRPDEEEASTGTGSASIEGASGTRECHIYSTVGDEGTDIDLQQYQSCRCGTGNASREVQEALWASGISEPTAGELAEMEHVTLEYVEDWVAYWGYRNAGSGERLAQGWLIKQMRAGRPAPRMGLREGK